MLVFVPLSDEDLEGKLEEVKGLGGDGVELRVDMFRETSLDYVEEKVRRVKEKGLKVILTVRSKEEGGRREVPNKFEIVENLGKLCDFVDLELSLGYYRLRDLKGKVGGAKLIVSYHDFERTPPPYLIMEILRECKRAGDIPKVAFTARSYRDCLSLMCVSSRFEGEKIVISMGKFGKVSRVSGFLFGSIITYAFLGERTAEGQLPLKELREIVNSLK